MTAGGYFETSADQLRKRPEPIDPTHAVALVTQLAEMYREGRGTDLTVVVGERRFEVHGCVMMCGSECLPDATTDWSRRRLDSRGDAPRNECTRI